MRLTESNDMAATKRKTCAGLSSFEMANTAVIFSLADGAVWASLPEGEAPVRLGRYDTVSYMMRDFLAQCDLAERLAQDQPIRRKSLSLK